MLALVRVSFSNWLHWYQRYLKGPDTTDRSASHLPFLMLDIWILFILTVFTWTQNCPPSVIPRSPRKEKNLLGEELAWLLCFALGWKVIWSGKWVILHNIPVVMKVHTVQFHGPLQNTLLNCFASVKVQNPCLKETGASLEDIKQNVSLFCYSLILVFSCNLLKA